MAESAGPVRCCPQLSATEQQPDHSSEPVGLATQSDISEETECYNRVLVYGIVFSNECHVSLIPRWSFLPTVKSCTVSMERCPECSSLVSGRDCSELVGCAVGGGVGKKEGGPFCRDRSGL